MPLETATYIPDLVPSNPAHTDGLSQADSHMRLLKSVTKATFPNFTSGALQSTQAALDLAASVAAGTSVSTIPLGTALLPGLAFLGNPNTGIWSPATNQIAASLNGSQVLLMGGTALVTSLGVAAAAFTTTGAYSGGTGQLVPIGGTLIWWDDVLPAEGGYAWANGQIIASANTVCPILLARWGSRFGGNGVTTMGVPNLCEAVPSGKSGMGGAGSPGRLQSIGAVLKSVLGAWFGSDSNTLVTANLPAYTPVGTVTTATVSSIGASAQLQVPAQSGATVGVGGTASGGSFQQPPAFSSTSTFIGTAQGGTSTAVNNTTPSTTCNFIIRLA